MDGKDNDTFWARDSFCDETDEERDEGEVDLEDLVWPVELLHKPQVKKKQKVCIHNVREKSNRDMQPNVQDASTALGVDSTTLAVDSTALGNEAAHRAGRVP